MYLPSTTATVRRAIEVIESHKAARRAPRVMWQGLQESPAALDARLNAIRGRLPVSQAVIAVCRGPALAPAGVRAVELAPKMFDLLHPAAPSRYRVASGGRGSAKSYSFATALILRALTQRVRILCGREIQRSIRESVHRLLDTRISEMQVTPWFDVREHGITAANGSEFLYEGLRDNISKIKSLEGISICYLEESETVSDRSLEVLIPTIRTPGSEIWLSLNPDQPDDPAYARFIAAPPPNCRHVHATFADNPWFGTTELEAERQYLLRVDPESYQHVWEGECRTHAEAQIFAGKYVVEAFTPGDDWKDPMHGADFGFSVDPSVLVKCWIHTNKLYIEFEAWQVGCETVDLARLFAMAVPGSEHATIFADGARPETISHLRAHGFPGMRPAEKWAGSVEDGVTFLRQFEKIIIHPRCVHTAAEARMYRYKVEAKTGKVLTDIVDADNHCINAIRYALHQKIRTRGMGVFNYYRELVEQRAGGQAALPQ